MRSVAAAIAATVLFTQPSRAADNIADLLGWVPGQANVVLFVDADALYKTEVAKKHKWGTDNLPTTGLDSIPPNVSKLVVASSVVPQLGPAWEVTVAGMKKPVTDTELAKALGGTKDTIGGKPVVVTQKYGIVANLAPTVNGAFVPPNRQEVGRWLRESTGKVPANFSPYLKLAASAVGPNAPVVLAFDSTDMFDPAQLRTGLTKSEALKGKPVNPAEVAELFAGMRGMTLTVRATDKLTGEIRLDFGKPAAALQAVAKPLMLELLGRMGVKSDEMDAWTATVRGPTLTLTGDITEQALGTLVAPFLRPNASAIDSAGSPGDAPDAKAQASLRYYRAVDKVMRDLRTKNSPSYPELAHKYNIGARQVDDLPILNVDDELIEWGSAVSTTFRSMAIMAQATSGMITLAEANKQMVTVETPNYYYGSSYTAGAGYWGPYGWGGSYALPAGSTSTSTASNYGAVANFQSMTNQQEHQYRLNSWKTMETATSELRRKMVKKYGIEF